MATCSIPSNPDAGGIGIRVGVYVQSLLPFVLSHLDQLLGTTEDRRQTGRQTANLVILTGLALLISAIIQERTFGLTVYHGIIVLNLCWISVVGSAPLFFLGIRDRVSSPEAVFRKFAFSLFSIKLFVMGGYGIWLNTRILSFDTSPGNCTTSTMVWWFGYRVPVTSMQSRGPLLALYGLMVIPGFNAAIFTWLLLGFWFENWVSLILHILHIPRSFRAHIVSACRKFAPILYWAITVMAILHTEMTIAINTVQPGEAVWTLGQTFAALVALIPLGGLFERLVYAVFRERPNDDEDLLAMLWRRLTPTALPTNNGTQARRGFVAKLYQILLRMLKSFLNNMPTPITVRQRTQLLTRVKEARYLINMIPRDLGRRAEITALEELRNRVMFLEELLKLVVCNRPSHVFLRLIFM
ncbi:hypothetical protein DL93DRAFT_1807032 [Clavulina sp. PMI_390]|nr:hypothetical protein DL93DRAFT_1807032 [Clavulina sp. PMI_390]